MRVSAEKILLRVCTIASLASNFMLHDVLGSLLAVLAFSLIFYAPGYLLGFAADFFSFRRMPFAERSFWAIALSFCVSPIAAHLVGRILGLQGVAWLFAISGLSCSALLLRSRAFSSWAKAEWHVSAAIAFGWATFVLLMLIDLQVGHRLFYSVVMADQSYRIAFTDAVVRTGIPPANPLYFAGSQAPMRYYYFWYVLCGAVVKIAHVSSRQAFVGSSVWAGFGLITVVRLYAFQFFRWSRRTYWTALSLLLVTGADLLPAFGNFFLQSSANGDMEWWSVDPIDAWPDSLLWVPHHVASVLCCLLAFLILWRVLEAASEANRVVTSIFAAAACASAFGLSVYVATGFALLMLAWTLRLMVRQAGQVRSWLRWLMVTALLSVLLLAPFLREILAGSASAGENSAASGSKHLLSLSVRPMIDSGLVTSLPLFSQWNRSHALLFDQAVRLLLLVPGLAMELGVYGIVLVLLWTNRRKASLSDKPRQTALFFCIAGLLMTMFISSSVISNNDFGYRAVMLPQFFLTLLTAEVISSWRRPSGESVIAATAVRRRMVFGLVVVGVLGSLCWAVLLRAWLPAEAAKADTGFSASPDDAFQTRAALEHLDSVAPQNAVLAFRDMDLDADRKDMEVMTPTEYFQRMLVMNAGRQLLNAEQKCATHFGGDPGACKGMKEATATLYSSPSPSAQFAEEYCRRYGVQYLLLSVRDAAWFERTGWPVNLPVIANQARFKAVQCSAVQ